jgi:hypothetical protein
MYTYIRMGEVYGCIHMYTCIRMGGGRWIYSYVYVYTYGGSHMDIFICIRIYAWGESYGYIHMYTYIRMGGADGYIHMYTFIRMERVIWIYSYVYVYT